MADVNFWLETLFDCKQLSEEDVKQLCEKVIRRENDLKLIFRLVKF
jgi:hypothetical protein